MNRGRAQGVSHGSPCNRPGRQLINDTR